MSYKRGDIIRASRDDAHNIRFGAVCTVLRPADYNGLILCSGPHKQGYQTEQFLYPEQMKPAKQATKKVSK